MFVWFVPIMKSTLSMHQDFYVVFLKVGSDFISGELLGASGGSLGTSGELLGATGGCGRPLGASSGGL